MAPLLPDPDAVNIIKESLHGPIGLRRLFLYDRLFFRLIFDGIALRLFAVHVIHGGAKAHADGDTKAHAHTDAASDH